MVLWSNWVRSLRLASVWQQVFSLFMKSLSSSVAEHHYLNSSSYFLQDLSCCWMSVLEWSSCWIWSCSDWLALSVASCTRSESEGRAPTSLVKFLLLARLSLSLLGWSQPRRFTPPGFDYFQSLLLFLLFWLFRGFLVALACCLNYFRFGSWASIRQVWQWLSSDLALPSLVDSFLKVISESRYLARGSC